MGMKGSSGKSTKGAGIDFQDMLTNALNAPEGKQETQADGKGKTEAAANPARTDGNAGTNPETEANEGEMEENIMAAAVSMAFVQIEASNEQTASETTPVHADNAQERAMVQPEAAPGEVPAKAAPEADGQAAQVQTETAASAQAQKEQPAQQAGTAGQSGNTVQARHDDEEAPAAAIHRELQAEGRTHRIQRAPTGEESSKLDDMFQKAAQELNQGKTAAAQAETETKPASKEAGAVTAQADTAEEPELPAKPAGTEPKAGAPTANETASQRLNNGPQVNVIRPERAQARPQEAPEKIDETITAQTAQKPEAYVREAAKPADTQPAQPVKAPEQIEQIRAQVAENIEKEKMEFRMQLNPHDLGRINIKMVLEGGKLAIEIMALNPKATEMLMRHTEGLAASLRTGNMEVSSVNIVTAGENVSAGMDGEYNLANPQKNNRDSGEANSTAGRGGAEDGAEAEEEEAVLPKGLLNYSI